MTRPPVGRRSFLAVLLAFIVPPPAVANDVKPTDQGIGGTGKPQNTPDDRGIGGTGLRGTITGFGSILVNARRVVYPPSLEVYFAGHRGQISELRVGHIVRIVAHPAAKDLTATRVDVEYDVVGAVDSLSADGSGIRVLGQFVDLAGIEAPAIGTRIAVSGLRQPDDVIVASLVEPARSGDDEITGQVTRDATGQPFVGSLRLTGKVPGNAIGRMRFAGSGSSAGFNVMRAEKAPLLQFRSVIGDVLVESIAKVDDAGLHVGSDLTVARPYGLAISNAPERLIVELKIDNKQIEAISVTPASRPAAPLSQPPAPVAPPAPPPPPPAHAPAHNPRSN